MLREVGVPAHHVFIPTTSMGNLITDFPYPWQFDHCIVAVDTKDGYRFLDPVYDNIPFDYLPTADQNRRVVIFDEQQPRFAETPLAKPEENAVVCKQKIMIVPDGSIEVDLCKCYFGEGEAGFRSAFANAGSTLVREVFEISIHKKFPGAKLIDYGYTDPFDFKKQTQLSMKYQAADYCKEAGDILIFRIPDRDIGEWSDEIGKEDRRYPFLHNSRCYRKQEVVFNIPEGYHVYHLPPQIVMETPYFQYRSSYEENGQKIFYQAELVRTALKIPAEEYNDYRNYCQMMDKSHTSYVLFKKKTK
jgi:hypothetical protein